jgi:hypothetical protein
MIEIIRAPELVLLITCEQCKAELSFEPEDVVCLNMAISYAGEEGWLPAYVINCPRCRNDIRVDDSINPAIKEVAKERRQKRVNGRGP